MNQASPNALRLLACISALSVANIYYNQPLLVLFARSFHASPQAAGAIPMVVQLSYAAGLLLFVPLGDRVPRGRLLAALLSINALGSLLAMFAPGLASFMAANVVIGASSVGAQVIIPAVSQMVPPQERGKAVGVVMSGLLAGVLMARILSGFVGSWAGWPSMYGLAIAIDLACAAIVLARPWPAQATQSTQSYAGLLRTSWRLFVDEPELRQACLCGALMFGAFSALWGSLAFLLAQPPYRFDSGVAGSFGLAGMVGMFASPFIGRWADRLGPRKVVAWGACVAALAFLCVSAAGMQLAALVVGVLLLDLGGRAGLVGNQLRALALSESARARLNTVFMTCYFLGGALGTRIGAQVGTAFGWTGIALLGLATSLVVVALNAPGLLARPKRAA